MSVAELVKGPLDVAVKQPAVYRIDLEGKVHDPERGFIAHPFDTDLMYSTEVRTVGRSLLLPIRDKSGAVQEVARAAAVLVLPRSQKGAWLLFLAADRPWTVPMAQYVIGANLGPEDAFNNSTGLLVPGRVHRFGPGFEDADIGHMWAPENKTLGVLAHASDRATLMRYRRLLEKLAPQYRDLLHIGLYDDPHGSNRAVYMNREFFTMLGHPVEVQMPAANGVRAMLPEDFPRDALPKDFPLTLSKSAALDAKGLEEWLDTLAQARLDPRWARHPAGEPVDRLQGTAWLEDVTRDVAVTLFQRLEETEQARVKASEGAAQTLASMAALREQHAARDAELERVREQLSASQASVRQLQTTTRLQNSELVQLRGLDAERLESRLAETQDQLGLVKRELATAKNALKVLRAHASQENFRFSDLAPDTWDDLFPLAEIFQRVDVPDWAVQPAYGVLDRGQESPNWLARTWEVLRKLEEYAAVKAAGARGTAYMNFRAYVTEYPAEQVTEKHVTLTESKSVAANPVMRRARTFPTPQGPQFFEAHVAIGSGKYPAPRLYYFDDTNGPGGKVYVGYIGPHLKNTMTN